MTKPLLAAVILAVLVSGCSSSGSAQLDPAPTSSVARSPSPSSTGDPASSAPDESSDETFEIHGVVRVFAGEFEAEEGDECTDTGAYDELVQGAEISIIGGTDEIASGELGEGTVSATLDGYAAVCEFPFEISDVPSGLSDYMIAVPYASPEYTEEDLQEEVIIKIT